MLTAMLAVDNVLGATHDIWSVNAEQDYHEEIAGDDEEQRATYRKLAATQPLVPEKALDGVAGDAVLEKVFARLDKAAFATAIGTVLGSTIFLATVWMLIWDTQDAGPSIGLLSQYFYGYSVSVKGALIGFLHTFIWGFLFGWLFAYLRNMILGLYVRFVVKKARSSTLRHLLDYI